MRHGFYKESSVNRPTCPIRPNRLDFMELPKISPYGSKGKPAESRESLVAFLGGYDESAKDFSAPCPRLKRQFMFSRAWNFRIEAHRPVRIEGRQGRAEFLELTSYLIKKPGFQCQILQTTMILLQH